jgi:hypothetical protein
MMPPAFELMKSCIWSVIQSGMRFASEPERAPLTASATSDCEYLTLPTTPMRATDVREDGSFSSFMANSLASSGSTESSMAELMASPTASA